MPQPTQSANVSNFDNYIPPGLILLDMSSCGSMNSVILLYQRLARPRLHLRDRDFGRTGLVFETETETFLLWFRVRD